MQIMGLELLEKVAETAINDNINFYAKELIENPANIQLAITLNKNKKVCYCIFANYDYQKELKYDDIVRNTKNFFKQQMLAPMESMTGDYFQSMITKLCTINNIKASDAIVFIIKKNSFKKDLNVLLCTTYNDFKKDYTFEEAINN